MNAFVVFTAVLACASAAPQVTINKIGYGPSTYVRAPAHDSASIESHRLGGNFAYSTAEAHAFARITPEISEAIHPVAETTHVHKPAPIAKVQPAPIVKTHHAASPVFGQKAVYAQEPVIGPVRAHTTVEQQVYKQQHVAIEPARVHVAHHATPVVAQTPVVAHPAPVAVAHAPVAVEAHVPVAAAAVEAVGYAGHPFAHGFFGHPAAHVAAPAHVAVA